MAIIEKPAESVSSELADAFRSNWPRPCADERGSHEQNNEVEVGAFSDSSHPRKSAANFFSAPCLLITRSLAEKTRLRRRTSKRALAIPKAFAGSIEPQPL